jgi:hypothetical protein
MYYTAGVVVVNLKVVGLAPEHRGAVLVDALSGSGRIFSTARSSA